MVKQYTYSGTRVLFICDIIDRVILHITEKKTLARSSYLNIHFISKSKIIMKYYSLSDTHCHSLLTSTPSNYLLVIVPGKIPFLDRCFQ